MEALAWALGKVIVGELFDDVGCRGFGHDQEAATERGCRENNSSWIHRSFLVIYLFIADQLGSIPRDDFVLQTRCFDFRWLQWRYRIDPSPTESADQVNGGGYPEGQRPVAVGVFEDVTHRDRRDSARD